MLDEQTCNVLREARGVDEARRFAGAIVANCDAMCREAIEMAVTELAENLVKYCESSAGDYAGSITIRNEPGLVRIRATNLSASETDADLVQKSIADLSATDDVRGLYLARMIDLYEAPELTRGRLGLLRMAYEGGFRLSCHHASPVLVIEAERRCARL